MNIATITNEEIILTFNDSMSQLLDVVKTFNDANFNQQPFEGSWTAGQVAEHLYKSISGMPGLLLSETRNSDRDPLEKCESIGSIFLNFEVKLKSPEFILPTNTLKEVDFFVNGFEKTGREIVALTGQVDLNRPYTRFPLPTIGELTGWEWIFFTATHIMRHTRQLKNIREHL